MATFRKVSLATIFGNKEHLRVGEDDDRLLKLLEADTSDIEDLHEHCSDESSGEEDESGGEEDENNGGEDKRGRENLRLGYKNEDAEDFSESSEEEQAADVEDWNEKSQLEETEAIEDSRQQTIEFNQLGDDTDEDLPLSTYQNLNRNVITKPKRDQAKNIAEPNTTKTPQKTSRKPIKPKYTWRKCDIFSGIKFPIQEDEDNSEIRKDYTPIDYFSNYLNDNDFKCICESTNVKYMLVHNKPLNLTMDETKNFFGIVLMMSVLKYPRIRMYWSKDTKVFAIATTMTRDRFFAIRSHLKVTIDGDISANARNKDKLWRVRPLLERIRQACLRLPRQNIVAIDEQMIPFTGVCGIKQFVRGKPNPEGLKNFVCAAPSGLVLDFEIYQGKDTFLHDRKELGVGPSAVIRLVETLKEGSHVFMDRYFTTIPLLEYLLEKKIHASGTILKSRVPSSVHLTQEKMLKRLGRGATEQNVRSDKKVNIIQWYDMKPVLLASTKLQEQPTDTCKRWSKVDKKFLEVNRPDMVAKYNSSMGGIDLVDRMIAYYRITARTNKWTVKTIFHFFDLAIANSWSLYRSDRRKFGDTKFGDKAKNIMELMDFKLKIAQLLLKQTDEEDSSDEADTSRSVHTRSNPKGYLPSQISSPSAAWTVGPNPRNMLHLPVLKSELKNSVRCKYPKCTKKTKFACEKCGDFFCITGDHNCFYQFHKK